MRPAILYPTLLIGGLLLTPLPTLAQPSSNSNFSTLTPTSALLLILLTQALVIIGLYKNRNKYKAAHKKLKHSQKKLEIKITERTLKLRNINDQLHGEISQHETTEALLRETRDYLHSIINTIPSMLIGVNKHGFVTHWNAAAEASTNINIKDALNKNIHQLCPELTINAKSISNTIKESTPLIYENIQNGSGSQSTYSDLTVYPLASQKTTGALIRIDDVTMRMRVENMMIQNEKMLSLGELAAGMAHEINNPLSAILHGVQNIQRRTTAGLAKNDTTAKALGLTIEEIQAYLEEREIFSFMNAIRDAGERSAKIVKNMLEFSRSNSREHSPVNMRELMEHTLLLAENAFELKLPEGAENPAITTDFEQNLPPLQCSAAEIQQVILNLLRNANQAFTSDDYGAPLNPSINLRLRKDKNDLVIEVEDNGPGMPDDIKRHVFEPFFTTKEVGKGTGLGLSVSYFIITEHHDGSIDVDSTPGKGTTFSIRLPINTQT